VTLTDRDKKILLTVLPLVVVVAYWFLLLSPKRQEASKAGEELARQEQRLDAARQQADVAKGAKTDFAADYAEIVRLGKAIPASVDMPSLLVQLESAAEGTGIQFTKIATADESTAAATTPPSTSTSGSTGTTPADAGGQSAQSQPGAAVESANTAQQSANQSATGAEQSGANAGDTQTSTSTGGGALPVGGGTAPTGAATTGAAAPQGLETVPLDMAFVGDFFNLADFFHRVKRFVRVVNRNVLVSGRLVTIDSLRYASDTEIFPRVRAELKATVYLSPKAEGATAGATPDGPSSTTPAESGGSSPSTSPAPAAVATR
jgi:Tfp pilus assembly protein PilO